MRLVIREFNKYDPDLYIEQLEEVLKQTQLERDAYKVAYEALLEDDDLDMDGRC